MIIKIDRSCAELGDTVVLDVGGRIVLIDKEDKERILGYTWYIYRRNSQVYAYRRVKSKWGTYKVWMHRQITHCPAGRVVHHINRCGLDNRKENLQVMGQKEHHLIHGFC